MVVGSIVRDPRAMTVHGCQAKLYRSFGIYGLGVVKITKFRRISALRRVGSSGGYKGYRDAYRASFSLFDGMFRGSFGICLFYFSSMVTS